MKKFFLFAAAAVAALTINATEWDFSDFELDATGLTKGSKVVDGLTFYAIDASADPSKEFASNKGFGVIAEKVKTFDDGFKSAQNCKTNGGGGAEEATPWLPKQRYFSFDVTGNSTIKVWYESGSSNAVKFFISDGTKLLFQNEVSKDDKDKALIAEASYVGGAGTIYIYGGGSIEVFKIEATSAQGINDVNAEVKAIKRFENGQLVIIKNGVKYNALGAVVE
jgi:hypothetical protein